MAERAILVMLSSRLTDHVERSYPQFVFTASDEPCAQGVSLNTRRPNAPASPANVAHWPARNQLRRRITDFAAQVRQIIDQLDNVRKPQPLRLLVQEARVTGWHIQIRLYTAHDPPGQPRTTPPTQARPELGIVAPWSCLRTGSLAAKGHRVSGCLSGSGFG
jgi:hypothetical protein